LSTGARWKLLCLVQPWPSHRGHPYSPPQKKPCSCHLCSIQRCVQFYKVHYFPVPWERWCSEGERLGRLALWFLSQVHHSAGEMVQSWREAGWVSVVVPAMLCHPSRGPWVSHGFPWALFHSLSSPEVAEMVLHPGGGSWVLPPHPPPVTSVPFHVLSYRIG